VVATAVAVVDLAVAMAATACLRSARASSSKPGVCAHTVRLQMQC
jgi:hypothetical protein